MATGFGDIVPGSRLAAALIGSFVVGVMAGALVGRKAERWRKQAVLGFVLLQLTAAATMVSLGSTTVFVPLLMASAMGSANAVFQRDGEVSIGVTYMTGTLVKFGQHLAASFAGGPRFAWLPYLLLWFGRRGSGRRPRVSVGRP